jgi:hypothetical protein
MLKWCARLVVVAVVVTTGVVTVTGCGPSRQVRHVNLLAQAAARNPTGTTVTLSPAAASPVVIVEGGGSGSHLVDIVGAVVADGGAKALEKKLQRIRLRDLNGRYAKAARSGIEDVFSPVNKGDANVIFELVIESVSIVAPDGGNAVAEMVVSARAVSRKSRAVLWRCEEVVAREVNSFVPVPRGSGGLFNLASVAALDDKALRKIFDGLADEAGRIVGRRVVNDSAR